jgi:hypothetical protein
VTVPSTLLVCRTLAALAALAALAPAARGAEASAPAGPAARQEWVGVEVPLLSYNGGTAQDGRAPSRTVPGLGATVWVLRRSWSFAYVTPLQAGLFLGGLGDDSIFVHVDVEGGLALREGPRALELGLAAGAGILAVHYGGGCDGSCNLGGAGVVLSPVGRYLFLGRPGFTTAFVMRVVIPLQVPSGDYFGHYTGRAVMLLTGLELAFGARR